MQKQLQYKFPTVGNGAGIHASTRAPVSAPVSMPVFASESAPENASGKKVFRRRYQRHFFIFFSEVMCPVVFNVFGPFELIYDVKNVKK